MAIVPHAAFPMVSASAGVYDRIMDMWRREEVILARVCQMSFPIRAMSVGDYPGVLALWRRSEGMGPTDADTEPAIADFLGRNPGMSAIASSSSRQVIGAVLCGHDGRRGYLHHLAVERSHRKQGVATAMKIGR